MMRVSVWQQFSSNHSSHFTVVGVFETRDAASYAADEIRAILDKIRKWHEENPEKSQELHEKWADGDWPPQPSEIEVELGKQYHVLWKGAVEWFEDAQISISNERLLILTTKSQTDWGPEPFNRLMECFGGHGLVTGSDIGGDLFGEITIFIDCEAPDEATAQLIFDEKSSEWCSIWQHQTHLRLEWTYDGFDLEIESLIQYLQNLKCKKISYMLGGKTYTQTERISVEDKGSKDT